ncbi:MAG TPA: DUF5985 family protein [Steroidobacteraceae bacterium]
MIEGFLLGVIVASSLTAGAFFIRFWKQTRDPLFLGFGVAFIIEGINRFAFLFLDHPHQGGPVLFAVRLFSYAVILAAIVNKNRT